MKGSSVLASALLAALLVAGCTWALNNTAVGLQVKCNVFNDVGACFIVALTKPLIPGDESEGGFEFVPPPTESPEERAAREAAARQARLDDDVRHASDAIDWAVDELVSNEDDLTTTAGDMTSAVAGLRESIGEGMQRAYDALKEQTLVRPMDDFAQNDVCFALNDVEFARNDVEFATNDFEFNEDPYKAAVESRRGYVASVEAAAAELRRAVEANPDGDSPAVSVADGMHALAAAKASAESAAKEAASASGDVDGLILSADALMTKAGQLAATVASC